MPRCPDCDEKVSAQDAECPSCGTPLRAAGKKKGGGGSSTTATIVIVLAAVGGMFLVCGGILIALLVPAVQSAREAARRAQSMNNMKQIGLGLHNYHESYNSFPMGGTFSEGGQGHHGWMTAILPYMDAMHLYGQIERNEPWNSPKNEPIFRSVLPYYQNPSVPEHADARGYALAHYAGNSQILKKNETVRIPDMTDGLSNTVLAGDVSAGYQPWGSPENTRDPAAGLGASPTQFGSVHPGICKMLMADGAVRSVSENVSPAVLKALATPAGKEPVGDF